MVFDRAAEFLRRAEQYPPRHNIYFRRIILGLIFHPYFSYPLPALPGPQHPVIPILNFVRVL
jgi:hypothetical protein